MCHKCPNCCSKSTCRDQIAPVLGKMGSPRRQPQSSNSPQRRLHPTLLVPAKLDQVIKHHKLLCKSPQEPLPVGGIASAYDQKCSGTGNKSNISGLLQPVVFGPQTQQPVETYPRPEQLEQIFKNTIIQNGDPRDNKDLPANRGMGDFNRFQGRILPHTYTEVIQSKKYMHFHIQDKSYQFKALSFGLSTAPMEFTVVAKEVKFLALQRGIRIHQYLDDWLVRARSHQICLQHTRTLTSLCQELGWLVNREKSELEPKQVFDFVGYQFDLREGKVRPTECWQTLQTKIRDLLTVRYAWSGN